MSEFSVRSDPAWREPTVGVIGGNGPAATALLLDTVVRRTTAASDQEHIDLIVLDHSTTPDRTARILDPSAPNPGPVLARDAARLEAWGAAFIAVPCNTATYFLDEVRSATSLPIVGIVAATSAAAAARGKRVGLLATDGTRAAKVYDEQLSALGAEAVLPGPEDQRAVMSVIYDGVKAGGSVDVPELEAIIKRLLERSDVVVLGCTELSVVYMQQQWDARAELVDSITCLADEIITRTGRTPRRGA